MEYCMSDIERNKNELLRISDLDNTKDIWVDADAFNEIDDQLAKQRQNV